MSPGTGNQSETCRRPFIVPSFPTLQFATRAAEKQPAFKLIIPDGWMSLLTCNFSVFGTSKKIISTNTSITSYFLSKFMVIMCRFQIFSQLS